MAGSVNKVILIGNLGKDPEVRSTQSGGQIANLNIATSESWKDKNSGERQERTEWHRVSIYNDALAKLAGQYLKKGSKVYIEGQLETRKWQDKDGQDRYTTEVVIRPFKGEMTFLDGRSEGGSSSYGGGSNQNYGNSQPQQQQAMGGSPSNAPMDDFEDEIPF